MIDFEDDWKLVRGESPIKVVSTKASDLESQLLMACHKAGFDLTQQFKKFEGEVVTQELYARIVVQGLRLFMTHWHEALRSQDLAGLVEIVLEGQSMPPAEMLSFVQALPESLLRRITDAPIGSTVGGIHALMAVEVARREGRVRWIKIDRDTGSANRVFVEFLNVQGQKVQFFLDEPFEVRE